MINDFLRIVSVAIIFVLFVDFTLRSINLADILLDASFRIGLRNLFNASFRNAPILIVDLPLNRKFRLTI